MLYYCAPMEGITGPVFRRVHRRFFPEADRYYTPFLSPTQEHRFTARDFREILPGEEDAVPLVPQLLTKSAEDFLWAAGELAAMGYEEVNFNLGCPSGTVVAKGKGAGLLADPEGLDALLGEILARPPPPVSVKTRLGLHSPAEFERLLSVYERHGLCELIIHPRTRAEQYTAAIHPEAFAAAAARCPLPLCYNGDIVSAAACHALEEEYPRLHAVMLGRGLIADPALIRRAKGGPALQKDELRGFLETLYEEYARLFGAHNAMHRMKEVWACLHASFADGERITGRIARARNSGEYEAWADTALRELTLLPR